MRMLVFLDIVDMIGEVIHQLYSTQQNFVLSHIQGPERALVQLAFPCCSTWPTRSTQPTVIPGPSGQRMSLVFIPRDLGHMAPNDMLSICK